AIRHRSDSKTAMRAACASGDTVFQRGSGIGGVGTIHSYYVLTAQYVRGVSAYLVSFLCMSLFVDLREREYQQNQYNLKGPLWSPYRDVLSLSWRITSSEEFSPTLVPGPDLWFISDLGEKCSCLRPAGEPCS